MRICPHTKTSWPHSIWSVQTWRCGEVREAEKRRPSRLEKACVTHAVSCPPSLSHQSVRQNARRRVFIQASASHCRDNLGSVEPRISRVHVSYPHTFVEPNCPPAELRGHAQAAQQASRVVGANLGQMASPERVLVSNRPCPPLFGISLLADAMAGPYIVTRAENLAYPTHQFSGVEFVAGLSQVCGRYGDRFADTKRCAVRNPPKSLTTESKTCPHERRVSGRLRRLPKK